MDPSLFPTLDPDLVEIVTTLPDGPGSLDDLEGMRAGLSALAPQGPVEGEDLVEITDELAGDVPVRVYRPRATAGDLPGVLYLHGGGFCLGDINVEHPGAVQLSHTLGAVVVTVGYRLAPEHPYPAGLEDCYTSLQFLAGLAGVDTARLAVHGQSAGGGLAAATALVARDRGGPALCFQSLGIPELDDRLGTPSMRAFTGTPMWTRSLSEQSWSHYLGGQEADGYAAPARMADLGGLPPAYVVTCELDPLRDEGLEYASRLLAAGVSVELHNFPGAFHGSLIVPAASVARRMNAELLLVLGRALTPKAPVRPT